MATEISVRPMTGTDYNTADNLLDFHDADAEFIEAFKNRKDMYSVWNGSNLAGAAQVRDGKEACLRLFIDTPYRRGGIGDAALDLCEKILKNSGADTIMTTYRTDHNAPKSFAGKHGYIRSFSSAYMEYNDSQFDIPALPVREYKDEDYDSAHEMYARAFHEMRVRVGDFPDSAAEQPSDSMRKHWDLTKKERLVYVRNGEIIGYSHIVGNEIGSISVNPQYQGQGIGRMFMKYIINKILADGYKKAALYCIVGNWAKQLYDSLGFADIYTVENAVKLIRKIL